MSYIKAERAFEKLKKAEEFFAPVIVTAAPGYGKSAAVKYYYRRKSCLELRCKDGRLTDMPDIDSIRANVVIIEDMQWLSDDDSIRYIKSILDVPGIQTVMVTRGTVPRFLSLEQMNMGLVRIQEADLTLDTEGVIKYFADHGIEIDRENAEFVADAAMGYVPAIHCYAMRMENGEKFSEGMRQAVWQDLFRIWDVSIYNMWIPQFINMTLSVCRFDKFTLEMAEYLTGDNRLHQSIESWKENMNILRDEGNGYYSIRPEMKLYCCWKQEMDWTKEEVDENYRRAAAFYEMKGEVMEALKYYRMANDSKRVKDLLVRNANTHPGMGHYAEFKDYYLELPREEIIDSPVLMAGMSMLYDLILEPEKSQEWRMELEKFEKDPRNSKELRRDARCRMAYLDIGLPHKGTKGIVRTLKNIFTLMGKGEVKVAELSVTGNMPSLMNGGLDFSDWSKNDIQIAKFMSTPVEILTGKYGKGLVTLALAESGFEKGTMSTYEVLTRCTDGFEAAAHGGRIEMCFASLGVQTRQHIIEGQMPSAKRIYDSFREKVIEEKATQLIPNMDAFKVWLSLFTGSCDDTEHYINSVPDPRVVFVISDRYRQMIKIRSLIALDRNREALDISSFLTNYFASYDRHIYWIENEILKSICLYRLGESHWSEHLRAAFLKAEGYHFLRLFSIEGAAVLPLLHECKSNRRLLEGVSGEFFDEVYNECVKVASFFPDYLRYIEKESAQLTKRESQVLSLLCSGMSTSEICQKLGISYEGLKKHNRGIYKKLGAKNRAEAERKAVQLGLVYRG